jgi:ABC-type transport system substrate-binding protein
VTSYTPGQSIVLVRNPRYHGGRPHRLDRMVLIVGISSQTGVADIEAGRADYTEIGGTPVSTVTQLAARLDARYGPGSPAAAAQHQQYFEYLQPELDFLILNTHRPLFSDRRLRLAVNYAIDRTALARLGDGSGIPDRPTGQSATGHPRLQRVEGGWIRKFVRHCQALRYTVRHVCCAPVFRTPGCARR